MCGAGDHKQARRAELQSRAELHEARLDALNAKQRHTPSAAKQVSHFAVSPMTQKAIVDLTGSPPPVPASRLSSMTQAPAVTAVPAPASTADAAQASSSQAGPPLAKPAEAAALRKGSAAPNHGKEPLSNSHTAPHAQVAAAAARSASGAAAGAAAGGRLDKSASNKERRPVSPSISRQTLKRRRSTSVSPSVPVSKGGRSQAGSQRQAVSSARRHATRFVYCLASRLLKTCMAVEQPASVCGSGG